VVCGLAAACADAQDSTPGGGSTGGSAPATGGTTPTPSAGSGGTVAMSGGTPGTGGASTGGVATGGAGTGGSAVGGTATGGTSGGAATGGMKTTGGAAGASGGSAAGPGDSDRCDVAVHDPANPPQAITLMGNLGTHDPVVIAAHDRFYLFSTGNNIGAKTSQDLRSWQGASDVFTSNRPAWLSQKVPGVSNLWAPDISYFGGNYHLYYSASTFGCNVSCIGHATRAALDSGSWMDHGPIVCSNEGANCNSGSRPDDWNAIDPNLVIDRDGTPWLSFGSFWGGLKLIELDATGARKNDELHSIAARPSAGGALEAPFIVRRCGYYYLFASFDRCCQGANSNYNIRVGRSESVTGPYLDREGTEMMRGGGTLLVEGAGRYNGPGHNAVIFVDDAAYNIYHTYDGQSNGASILRISELAWDDEGWPISGGP
jgi:arabinan endo-1,5-alpha-L-arabinosidase